MRIWVMSRKPGGSESSFRKPLVCEREEPARFTVGGLAAEQQGEGVRRVLETIGAHQVQREPEFGTRMSRIQAHHPAELADSFGGPPRA